MGRAGLKSHHGEERLFFTQHKYIPQRERAIIVHRSGAVCEGRGGRPGLPV